MEERDTLVWPGGPLRAIDHTKQGGKRVEGYLVLFSTKHDPDLVGDFFDSRTSFFLEEPQAVRPVFWNHGTDTAVGTKQIGTGVLTKREAGIWLEARLLERDEYVDMIYELCKQGACGLSSGAISYICRREPVTKAINWVQSWPICEASVTNTPCEVRTQATALDADSRASKFYALSARLDALKRLSAREEADAAAARALRFKRQGAQLDTLIACSKKWGR